MKIVIIDYGAGNIQSLKFALQRLGQQAELSNNPAVIRSADKVIFPGVGQASSAMSMLCATGLDSVIPALRQPVLGICLGMQLMCLYSEEGDTKGLGIFGVPVRKFDQTHKVPQIGWNQITNLKSPLFDSVPSGAYIYSVHSYFADISEDTSAMAHYGTSYSAALCRDNFYGTQFHPEKSSTIGARVLQNFLAIN